MKPVILAIHTALLLSLAQLAAPARAQDDLPCGPETVSQAATAKQWFKWLKGKSDDQSWRIALCNYITAKHENVNLNDFQKISIVSILDHSKIDLDREIVVREILMPFYRLYPYFAKSIFERAVDKKAIDLLDQTAFPIYTIAKQGLLSEKRTLPLQEKRAIDSGNGNEISWISQSWFAVGEFKRAADLARTALRLGVRDKPKTQLILGISLVFAGDLSRAEYEFKNISTKGREKEIVDFWILYLNNRSK